MTCSRCVPTQRSYRGTLPETSATDTQRIVSVHRVSARFPWRAYLESLAAGLDATASRLHWRVYLAELKRYRRRAQ